MKCKPVRYSYHTSLEWIGEKKEDLTMGKPTIMVVCPPEFLQDLFKGQNGEEELQDVINIWKEYRIPSEKVIEDFYDTYY